MAKSPRISTKRMAISRNNARMVAVVGVSAFISVFCLVASNAVLKQTRYQARLTKADQTATVQLKANIKAFTALVNSYQTFDSQTTNVLGGSSTGPNSNDGDNAKIVLDALPSTYDFPALTSSLEQILGGDNLKIGSIGGTDDQINQQGNTTSPDPQPVSIPFTFTVTDASYASVQLLMNQLDASIRPMQVDTLSLTGASNDMTLTVAAHTFYQPGKSLSITKETIK